MSEPILTIDLTSFHQFEKWMKNNYKQFATVTAMVLNEFGFLCRAESIRILKQSMIIRNERFLNSSMRVTKTKGSIPVMQQQTIVGSLLIGNSSGWAPQEFGTPTRLNKLITPAGRNGDMKNELPKELRTRSKSILTESQFPGTSTETRTISMLRAMNTLGSDQPFRISKGAHRKLKAGLYQMQKRRLMRLQNFEQPTKIQRQIHWMEQSRNNVISNNKVRDLYYQKLTWLLNRNK
jgi:hypothetical protein